MKRLLAIVVSMRSVLLGLCGVAFVCGYTYFNDLVLWQTYVVGGQLPISVYGLLLLFLMFVQPLLRLVSRRLALSRQEIAVVLVMTFASCAIPAGALLRHLPGSLITPHQYAQSDPAWKARNVLDLVPQNALVDVRTNREHVLNDWTSGLGTPKEHISLSAVPWRAWLPAFGFWLPVILSLWIALLGLALVTHRQWADHEHLPYPIVTFTEGLLPQPGGERSSVFRSRLFWGALVIVLSIHLHNYLFVLFKQYMVKPIPLIINLSPFLDVFPTFNKGGGGWLITECRIFFSVIAIAYFLPKDVSLSIGIGPFIWFTVMGVLASYGASGTTWQQGAWRHGVYLDGMAMMGAFAGMFAMLVYTGRHYFRRVFARAVGFGDGEIEHSAVWGARVFMLFFAFFCVWTTLVVQCDWLLSILVAVICVAVYLVIGRLVAETGMFYINAVATPTAVLWAFFGTYALGPKMLAIVSMLGMMLLFDTREALFPYLVNSLKLAADVRVKLGRAAWLAFGGIAVGMVIGIVVTLFWMYDQGTQVDFWPNKQIRYSFDHAIEAMDRLESQDQLATAGKATGFARVLAATPNKPAVATFGIGMGLVLLFSYLRLRFAKWPFHPVMFITSLTYTGVTFAFSLLLGWCVKAVVMKYGGSKAYQNLKPVMFGLLGGEVLGAVVPMAVSLVHYLITGEKLQGFNVMPL